MLEKYCMKFKYLETRVIHKFREDSIWEILATKQFKNLSSHVLSKNVKVKIYKAKVLAVLYASETNLSC